MKTDEIHNGLDVIDSRDISARLVDLEDIYNDYQELYGEERDEYEDDYADELEEYEKLKEFAEEAEEYAPDSWQYGVTFINENYWVEYVEELLKDIGDLPSKIPWYIEIDWEKTAENIRADYSTVEFDGVDYYVR